MMEMLQTSEKFLSEEKLEETLIDVIYQRNLLPEPAVLKFRLERFNETLSKHGRYESLPLSKDGFSWKVQCVKSLTLMDCYRVFLQLEEGLPGDYVVEILDDFGVNDAVTMHFKQLCSYAEVGEYEDLSIDTAHDTAELEIRIQQARSHAERCIQLEHYVKRLEAKNSENELFMRYLAEYQSKMGSIWFDRFSVGFINMTFYFT